jgi:hypothetical protein
MEAILYSGVPAADEWGSRLLARRLEAEATGSALELILAEA